MFTKKGYSTHQKNWAEKNGLSYTSQGYLGSCKDNLFEDLSSSAKEAFTQGEGNELKSKMKAMHSSSALAVNVFHYWATKEETERTPLRVALSIQEDALIVPCKDVNIKFEFHPSWPLSTIKPNIDVLYGAACKGIGIESKLLEWLGSHAASFGESYFKHDELWNVHNLPKCQKLVHALVANPTKYKHLDVAQLLKHSLGLATHFGRNFELRYVYYDLEDPASKLHKQEINEFTDSVGQELNFHAITYQDIFKILITECESAHSKYIQYLAERYFPTY